MSASIAIKSQRGSKSRLTKIITICSSVTSNSCNPAMSAHTQFGTTWKMSISFILARRESKGSKSGKLKNADGRWTRKTCIAANSCTRLRSVNDSKAGIGRMKCARRKNSANMANSLTKSTNMSGPDMFRKWPNTKRTWTKCVMRKKCSKHVAWANTKTLGSKATSIMPSSTLCLTTFKIPISWEKWASSRT